MKYQLSDLYELIKKKVENYEKDLEYCNNPDIKGIHFPLELYHLKDEDYICCNQKLIYWDDKNERFLLFCLYNSNPCMTYKTKEGVLGFLNGEDSSDGFPDYEENSDEYHKGYCDGVYFKMKYWVINFANRAKENVLEDGVYMNDTYFMDIKIYDKLAEKC